MSERSFFRPGIVRPAGWIVGVGIGVLGFLGGLGLALPATADTGADSWTSLGPEGGTVTAVAVDPGTFNIAYAGTPATGVYWTRNGGRLWQRTGLDGAGRVTWLGVARGPGRVYALAGDKLYRSPGRGEAWTALDSGLRAASVTSALAVALPPGEPDTVYVAGSAEAPGTGGTATVFRIVKSTDAGNSWATSWEPADPGTALLQLVADPNDPQTVVASTGASIYRTVDGGLTWKAGNLRGTVRGLAIEHGPRRRVLAWELVGDPRLPLHTAFFVSSDQGLTWRPRPADFAGQALDGLVTDPTAPGAFYAFDAFGQLFHSGDVGLHWQPEGPTPNGPVHDLAPDPLRPGVAFVAVDGGRLGRTLWKTAHFGAAWTLFQSGISAGDFLTVTPDPANPATLWAGAGALGGSVPGGSPLSVWKSTDRGASWTAAGLQAALVPAIGFGSQGSQGSQGRQHRLFAATLGSQLQKSDDGGRTWSPIAATGYFVEALAIPAEEPATVYALSDRVTAIGLDVSLDNGATWKTRRANALILTVAPGSPATLYADQGIDGGPEARSGVQRSTDRGVTWTTLLELPAGSVRAIAIDPATPRRIVAGFERRDENGELHGGIEISRDYGATWREVGLAPGSPGVLSLLADPLVPHGFLAGTRSGVYASPDGLTWTLLGEGLPRIPVIHLSAGPGASHTLYAATEGGGIYNLERTAP